MHEGSALGWRRFVICCLVWIYSWPLQSQVISDSLVENLSCDDLSVEAIFQSIRSHSFSESYHLPLVNYSFETKEGICSGLSSLQRYFFYFARFSETQPLSQSDITALTDMLRGRRSIKPKRSKDHFEYQLIKRRIFYLPEKNTVEESLDDLVLQFRRQNKFNALLDIFQFKSNLSEVFSNISTFLSRSLAQNQEAIWTIVRDLPKNIIHKLAIFSSTSGHAVLPTKLIEVSPYRVVLGLYDPNFPRETVKLVWTPYSLRYEGVGTYSENEDLFAMLSNEADLGLIQRVLLKHYVAKCDEMRL